MNYIHVYQNICLEAKGRTKTIGLEKHHILPKSIYSPLAAQVLTKNQFFGLNSKENIVFLNLREHLFCHRLLVRIFCGLDENCYQRMIYAFHQMKSRTPNSHVYERERSEYAKTLSVSMRGKPSRAKGTKWTEEHRKRKHHLKDRTYEDIYGEGALFQKKTRSEAHIGMKPSFETKQKMHLSKLNQSADTRKKISISHTGMKTRLETKEKLRNIFSGPNSPNADKTKHLFLHEDGREELATKAEMKQKYGIVVYPLVNGKRNVIKGWSLKEKSCGK